VTLTLPRLDGRALDAAKLVAALAMVVDHVGAIWLHRRWPVMDAVGRVSFPLFAYAAAVAADRAGVGGARSVARLLLLAITVEPLLRLARPDLHAVNVLFTLALGMALGGAWSSLDARARALGVAGALGAAVFPQSVEFGLAGVLLPAALVAALRGERGAFLVAAALLPFLNVPPLRWAFTEAPARVQHELLVRVARDAVVVAVVPLAVVHACARLPGDGRLLPRYFLHVFYPAHLLFLWATKQAVTGA
jgi:hypothetical protein